MSFMNKENKQSRRKFLSRALGLVAIAAVSPASFFKPKRLFASDTNETLSLYTVDLSQYYILGIVGGSVGIKIPGTSYQYTKTLKLPFRFLLTRTSATAFLSEEGYCTHQQAPLNPYDGTNISCVLPASGGHGSRFALDGTVLNSPALRNLAQYTNSYDSVNNTVTIDVSNLNLSVDKSSEFTSELFQNFPNPVKNTTTIRFKLGYYSKVSLTVTDMLGHIIAVLTDGELPAGEHSFDFDASIWNSGTYFYHLNIEGQVFTKQMVVAK
jgi:hypothetical protein